MDEMKHISLAGLRSMFYMVTPNESSFQHVEEVPKYTSQVGRSPPTTTLHSSGAIRALQVCVLSKNKKATATPSPFVDPLWIYR